MIFHKGLNFNLFLVYVCFQISNLFVKLRNKGVICNKKKLRWFEAEKGINFIDRGENE